VTLQDKQISERKKASDFPQELLDLLDSYVHGAIGRREFLDGAQKFAVGGVTAAALFEMLKPNYAWAIQVPENDSRIRAQTVSIPSPQGNGSINGYLVRPASAGNSRLSAILVVHENRGLNPYVKDVARRLATSGYMALAPDGLTSVGGYPGDDEKGGQLFGQVDRAKMQEDMHAAAVYLKNRPDSNGRLGATGFCYGGGVTNQLAVRMGADLAAGVPYYGAAPAVTDVPKIKAAMLVLHGEADTRLVAGWPAYQEALKAAGVPHDGHVYPKAQHGFHNDTTPRYDEAAAKDAWTRTVAWFDKHVKA
jgi:carboxymethylenebutenolidase